MKRFIALLLFLATSPLLADQTAISKFNYLNNNQSSVIIDNSEAQDLLNVDVSPGGKSIKKRAGYGLYKALGTGQSVHGGYHFFDSSGNDIQVWGSSTSLYGIVADGTPTQLISSGTLNATWDCSDTQGNAYCADSSRDAYIQTNGATKTWYTSPLGTMVATTPDRVVVAGVTGNLNTLYYSGSGAYTNFVVGLNSTDPFNEVIASPGSKLTHIRWGCGKLLWWKDQSFGYVDGDNQFNLGIKIVSDNIGTTDNSSSMDPGGDIWFRGQSGDLWKYDCSGLQKMSIPITPAIQASGKRVSNSWTQDSQSDFQAGISTPTNHLSFTISPGDVTVSSFTTTENSSTSWTNGTASNTTVNPSSITLSTNNSGSVTNPSFESSLSGNWTLNHSFTDSWRQSSASSLVCGNISAQNGSNWLQGSVGGTASFTADFQAIDNSNSTLQTLTIPSTNICTTAWTQTTLTPFGSNVGKRVKFRFHINDSFNGDSYMTTSDSYIWGGPISFYYINYQDGASLAVLYVDNVQNGSSTITTGTFTSQAINTGFRYSTVKATASWTVNTTTPTFVIQKSTSATGVWADVGTSTGTDYAVNQQYIRYLSTFTITNTDNALSTLSGIYFLATSSGSYYSAVKNAPNLTQWDVFNADVQNNGGTHTFYMRSSTNSFTTNSSTPAWTAQTVGALVAVSTGTYFQVRDDFSLSLSSATPKLNDFIVNWYEGTATDQAYSLYHDNAIWWSVAYGDGQTTNNYIFKYDLINDGWTLYNFGAGGMLVQNNNLYFGSTSAGNLFKFGSGTSDNGAAINAYWKSKDFTGSDPWLQNQYTNIDTYFSRNANQNISINYALDTSTTTTSYTVSLSSTTKSVIVSNKLLPSGKYGNQFNVQVGDTSDASAWEFLGLRFTYIPQPYRPN